MIHKSIITAFTVQACSRFYFMWFFFSSSDFSVPFYYTFFVYFFVQATSSIYQHSSRTTESPFVRSMAYSTFWMWFALTTGRAFWEISYCLSLYVFTYKLKESLANSWIIITFFNFINCLCYKYYLELFWEVSCV